MTATSELPKALVDAVRRACAETSKNPAVGCNYPARCYWHTERCVLSKYFEMGWQAHAESLIAGEGK